MSKSGYQYLLNYRQKQKGFSLIELLIVLSILLITLTGVVMVRKRQAKSTPSPTLLPTPTEIQPTRPDNKSEKISAEVYQKLKENGRVTVIVSLHNTALPVYLSPNFGKSAMIFWAKRFLLRAVLVF